MNAGSVRSWCMKLSPHSHICPARKALLASAHPVGSANFQAFESKLKK